MNREGTCNFGLSCTSHAVSLLGQGGMMSAQLGSMIRFVRRMCPGVVLLEMGSKEMCPDVVLFEIGSKGMCPDVALDLRICV